MDSIPKLLTLNQKGMILLSMLEEHFHAQEKHLPIMLKTMYKPMLNTITMFLNIMPEETLQKHVDHARLMVEAIQCEHKDNRDFHTHISELLAAWT